MEAGSERIENDNFILIFSALNLARSQLTQVPPDIELFYNPGVQGMMKFPLLRTFLEIINQNTCPLKKFRASSCFSELSAPTVEIKLPEITWCSKRTGVILNLALWFGLHVLFAEVKTHTFSVLEFLVPNLATFNGPAVMVFVLAVIALFRFHIGVIPVILGSILLGLGISILL